MIKLLDTINTPSTAKFSKNTKLGWDNDINLKIFLVSFVKFLLDSWKRFISYSSFLKARITRTPVKFSLDTWFKRSKYICCLSEIGFTKAAIITIATSIIGIAIPTTVDNDVLVYSVIEMLATIINGVNNAVRNTKLINCCNWNTSLVVRIIMDEIPNLSYSAWENVCDFEKISLRMSLAALVEIFEDA